MPRVLRSSLPLLLGALSLLFTSALLSQARMIDGFQPDEVVTYKEIDDTKLKLDIFYPENHQKTEAKPAVIFFYAGGWAQGHPSQFHPQCEYLASRGMVAISADYRVTKRDKVTPVECLKDAKSAIRWLRKNSAKFGIDPNRIAAGGGSAGGHLAAATAVIEKFNEEGEHNSFSCIPSALVLFSAVIDNSEQGFGHRHVKDFWQDFSPAHNLSKNIPPTITFYGKKDKALGLKIPRKFKEDMDTLGCRCDLHHYDGETHGFYNFGKPHFKSTLLKTDAFFVSLGYLTGNGDPELITKIESQGRELSKKEERERLAVASSKKVHMANGMKIGEVDSTSAIVWTRLTKHPERNLTGKKFEDLKPSKQPHYPDLSIMQGSVTGQKGEVKINYWPKEKPEQEQTSDWISVDDQTDFIHQFRIKDLQPDTEYEVLVQGKTDVDQCSLTGKLRTAPAQNTPSNISFVVTTCGEYPRRDDDLNGHLIYQTMLGLKPHFLVHTGDAEYYDRGAPQAVNQALARLKWNRLYAMPFLRTFHNQVPCYFMKDDHDLLKDDCWPGQNFGDLTWEQGLALHKEQVPMGDKPYRTIRWGKDLQIWLVEGREYRSPNTMEDGPEKTIWGKEQKAWFFKTVEESDATYKILISATPLVGPDKKRKKDNHCNPAFAHEGNEIRDFITKQDNMYIVCGDRHWQYSSIDPRTGVLEFSCGPASDNHADGYKEEPDPLMHKFLKVRGGFLRVIVKDKKLTFNHHAVDGNVRHEEIFPAK